MADAEEAELVVLFENEKPEEVAGEVGNENEEASVADVVGSENPGAEEPEVGALGKANPGAEAAELETENAGVEVAELGNENAEAEVEELVDGVRLNGEAEDDPNKVDDPKRPGVDPELVPNKDGVGPPVEAAGDDPNMPADAKPVPNCGAVLVAVGTDVDEPNCPKFRASPDPNVGAVVAVVDAGTFDPKRPGAVLAADPNKGVLVLLAAAAED